jgi:hypothetical protein
MLNRIRIVPAVFALAIVGCLGSAGARADDLTPEQLLENNGLMRKDSGYFLKDEADVKLKLVTLRTRVGEMQYAFAEKAELEEMVSTIQGLNQQSIELGGGIATLNLQMEQYPNTYRGGRWVRGSNNLEQEAFNQLKIQRDTLRAQLTDVNTRRDTLRNLAPGQKLGPATARAKLGREAAWEALGELRQAVDSAAKRYDELGRDADVKRALRSVGQVSLVPSEEHLANVKALEQFERTAGLKPPAPKPNDSSRKTVRTRKAGR